MTELHGPEYWQDSSDLALTGGSLLEEPAWRFHGGAGTPPPARNPQMHGELPEASLRANLRWSLGLHAALALIVVVQSLVFPSPPRAYKPALRVDLVGLPDILKKDLSQISPAVPAEPAAPEQAQEPEKETQAAPPVEKPEPANPQEMVLHSRKESIADRNRKRLKEILREQEKDLKREKKMQSALERMKSLARIRSQVAERSSSRSDGLIIKGNQLSKGSSLSGDAVEQANANYYDLVRDKLQKSWELPVWLARQNLSATVEVFIDPKGLIRKYRFTKESGNPQFDEAVKRTLTQAQPFPRPPKEDEGALMAYGISLGFPL